jgi:hypothetical protein
MSLQKKRRASPAKGRAPPRRRKSDVDAADLARQVRRVYADRLAGRLPALPVHRDALRVANGLAALEQLIDRAFDEAEMRGDLAAFYECGLIEAGEILDALTTGKSHPMWRYVDGMKAAGLKLQNPSPSSTERQRRVVLLVFVEAYRISHKLPIARQAAEQAIADYFNGWNNIQLTGATLSGWRRLLSPEDRDFADAAAPSLIVKADHRVRGRPLPDKVLRLAEEYFRTFFGVAQ